MCPPLSVTEELIKKACQSSRRGGSVGKDPLCYRFLRDCFTYPSKWPFVIPPDFSKLDVLDFGAGKGAPHSQRLRDAGFNSVTAYDLPANLGPEHDEEALASLYDVIVASNVLNVQGTREMLMQTLRQIQSATKEYGYVICNYPNAPRYAELSNDEIFRALCEVFRTVQIIEGKRTNKQSIMFVCIHHGGKQCLTVCM